MQAVCGGDTGLVKLVALEGPSRGQVLARQGQQRPGSSVSALCRVALSCEAAPQVAAGADPSPAQPGPRPAPQLGLVGLAQRDGLVRCLDSATGQPGPGWARGFRLPGQSVVVSLGCLPPPSRPATARLPAPRRVAAPAAALARPAARCGGRRRRVPARPPPPRPKPRPKRAGGPADRRPMPVRSCPS